MIGSANIIGGKVTYTLKPITGALSIDSFIDSITGETADRYFDKYFSYAIEGLFFTDFKLLTIEELQAITPESIHSYVFKIEYIRAGADNTGVLTLNTFTIQHTDIIINNGYEYDHSNFIRFFNSINEDVETWAVNVLNKIFKKGALAKYIERGIILTEE